MITKKQTVLAFIATTTLANANFFADMDAHFKQLWNTFEHDISTATKNGSLSINSSYDDDKNAVIIKVTIPGLTEKDINFTLEDNRMVLEAKTDGRESLVVITEKSILVEQTEYEELTNKSGKVYTFTTGHNRVVNSLPRGVVLHEAQAEYENGVLTITLPSSAKKIAIPVVYKGSSVAKTAEVSVEQPVVAEKKQEVKKIIIKSKKQQKEVTPEDAK